MAFRFRNFPIYSSIRTFIKNIYILASNFPKKEQFELSSQLRRAVCSIALNLSEGSMKKSDKELRRYLMISIGSVAEVASILDIALDLEYLDSITHNKYMIECESIARQLYGFARSINKQSLKS